MFVISIHLHGEAQTPVVRFVVDILLQQVCNKYTTNETDGASTLASTVVGVSNRGPPSTAVLISLKGVPWRNFYKSKVADAKWVR